MKKLTKISEDIIRKAKEMKNNYNRENKLKHKREKTIQEIDMVEEINDLLLCVHWLEKSKEFLNNKIEKIDKELQPKRQTKEEIKKLKNSEYCRRWREKNKEHIKEYSKNYWINKVLKEEENN